MQTRCPSGHFVFSRRRRTYIRVPKTDLGYLGFHMSGRNADFLKFAKSEILVGGKKVAAPRHRRHRSLWSCPGHGFEGFDSHWPRTQRFHRPKLKLQCHDLTFFYFSFLEDLDRGWWIPRNWNFSEFFEKMLFGILVTANVQGAPPTDSNVFVGVFGMCVEFICAHGTHSAVEIQKIHAFFVAGHHNMSCDVYLCMLSAKAKEGQNTKIQFSRFLGVGKIEILIFPK